MSNNTQLQVPMNPSISSKEDVLRFMFSLERSIERGELISRGLTRSTATRYLKQLVDDGRIERLIFGHCQLTTEGRLWASAPIETGYRGSLGCQNPESTQDQNEDQQAQKWSHVPQNGGYGRNTNNIDEVATQSARKAVDNEADRYSYSLCQQSESEDRHYPTVRPHESRSDSSRPSLQWTGRKDLPAAIYRLLIACSKSAYKFRTKTILQAKENRRSVPQTQLINVPIYLGEAMNIDKYFKWNDYGEYVGLKESYRESFHSTMTALASEAGRNYTLEMLQICQILDHEEILDNINYTVETPSGLITEFQLVNRYARPDYIRREKKREYARKRRWRLAAEERAAAAVLHAETQEYVESGLSPEEALYISTEREIRWYDPETHAELFEFASDGEVDEGSDAPSSVVHA